MSKYSKNYQYGITYDIPHSYNKDIEQTVLSMIAQCESTYRIPRFIVMNPNAYSCFCSALSDKAGFKEIQEFTEYSGCQIVVIPSQHHNGPYQPTIFGVFPNPGYRDFFRTLNQEQFIKDK